MAKKSEPTRGFFAELDETLVKRIDEYCDSEGRSRKWLATKAITAWLDANAATGIQPPEPKKPRKS